MINSGTFSIDNLTCSKINVAKGAELIIGDYSGMSNCVIQCLRRISIGKYVNVGAGCMILDSDFHSLDWRDREDRVKDVVHAKSASIEIGDHVFIGARSLICKGVHIGARSVIAAGSVVVNDIPEDCVAGGNPCKVIKHCSMERIK